MFLIPRKIEHLIGFLVYFTHAFKNVHKSEFFAVTLRNFLYIAGLNILQRVLDMRRGRGVDYRRFRDKRAVGIYQVYDFQKVRCAEVITFLSCPYDFVDSANNIGCIDIVFCRDVAFLKALAILKWLVSW